MGRAQERQQRILEILSFRRSETMANIADELGVSIRTIRYDIDALTGSAPIYTVKGNGGSVRVADGYSSSWWNRSSLEPAASRYSSNAVSASKRTTNKI